MKLRADETELEGRWIAENGLVRADATCERIARLIINALKKVAVSEENGGWETLYQDPQDGRYWEHTYSHGEMHGLPQLTRDNEFNREIEIRCQWLTKSSPTKNRPPSQDCRPSFPPCFCPTKKPPSSSLASSPCTSAIGHATGVLQGGVPVFGLVWGPGRARPGASEAAARRRLCRNAGAGGATGTGPFQTAGETAPCGAADAI